MNIAFFTESYKPYISGVTVSVATLTDALRALGHRVYVFAPSYKGHKDSDRDVFRFPSAPSKYPGFRLAIPFSMEISKKLPKLGIDVIHSHSPFQLGLLGKSLAKKLNVPFVYTFHTLFEQYLHYAPLIPREISKKILSAYLKHFCDTSDCVVVPSKPVLGFLKKEGVKSRIEIVPTGINFEASKQFTGKFIREKHRIPASAVILLYVGRLSEEKNIPFLFKALKIISSKHPRAHMLLAAGGPQADALKALAKELGLSSRITFAGQIKQPDIFDYYAGADIFVFASTTETQGLVIAEAAGSGLPVVAVDAGGVSDTILDGKHGYLVPHDLKEFARRVGELILNEEKRKKMALAAKEFARERFSARAYAKKAEKIYLELMAKKTQK